MSLRPSSTTPGPGATGRQPGPLGSLDSSNASMLAKLRDPAGDNKDLLVALLTTSCMLELSKLVAARLDLPSFAGAAVDVVTQFAPVGSCAMLLQPCDIPPVKVTVGGLDLDDAVVERLLGGEHVVDLGTEAHPLEVAGEPVGYLSAGALPDVLAQARLIEQAATQISSGIGMLLEAERLRRRAAVARSLEMIAGLHDGYGEEQLREIADALSCMPAAVGAVVQMANPRLGGPVEARAGLAGGEHHTEFCYVIDERAPLDVSVSWGGEPSRDDVERVDEVLAALVLALERVEQNVRLLNEVESDALTGVGNRRRASKAMAATRNRAERKGEPFAVLILDLDHFKKVNDTLGHDAGDAVLVAFARALEATVRSYDTVARWGGEEFVVVCPDTDATGAQALAARVLSAVPTACAPALPDNWSQTCSIGVAVYPAAAENPDALLRAADKALYEAKAAGRNRLVVAGAPSPAGQRISPR